MKVLLVGDSGQLPPVQGFSVWDDATRMTAADDVAGACLYKQFTSVIELTINRRVDGSDDASQQFCELQGRIRDAEVTEEDWHLLKTRSRDSLGHEEVRECQHNDGTLVPAQECARNLYVRTIVN